MRKAVGLLIVLWGLSKFFSSSFDALDEATTESLKFVEASAVASQSYLEMK